MSALITFLNNLSKDITLQEAKSRAILAGLVTNDTYSAHVTRWFNKHKKSGNNQLELKFNKSSKPKIKSVKPTKSKKIVKTIKVISKTKVSEVVDKVEPKLPAIEPPVEKGKKEASLNVSERDLMFELCMEAVSQEIKDLKQDVLAKLDTIQSKQDELGSNFFKFHTLVLQALKLTTEPETTNSNLAHTYVLRLGITIDKNSRKAEIEEKFKNSQVKLKFINIDGVLPTNGLFDYILFNKHGGHSQRAKLEKTFGSKIIPIHGGVRACIEKIDELINAKTL